MAGWQVWGGSRDLLGFREAERGWGACGVEMYSLLAFHPTALISVKQSRVEEENQGCFYFPLVKVLKEKGGY